MGRSRSRTPSRKSSRSKHSKKSRHRTPERKSYRHRSVSSSDSSSRYKSSSSKYKRRKHSSRSPSSHRNRSSRRHRRSSSSSHSSSSSSSSSRSSSRSHRSSSSEKRQKIKPSSSYMDKIRSIRTPTPPKLNFDASMELLDKRHATESLADINADEFKPKAFNSKSGKSDADIIKIKGETRPIKTDVNDDPLFHQKVFGDDDARMEQWVHRVYTYRQKMFATTN